MPEICYRYGCSFPVGLVAPIVEPVIRLDPLTEKRMHEMVEAVKTATKNKPKKRKSK